MVFTIDTIAEPENKSIYPEEYHTLYIELPDMHLHNYDYTHLLLIMEWSETFGDLRPIIAEELRISESKILGLKYRRILRSKTGFKLADHSTPILEGMASGREGNNHLLLMLQK